MGKRRDVEDGTFAIVELDLSFNQEISDESMPALFECIGQRLPALRVINLSSTSVTDKTCSIIHGFCNEYKQSLHLRSINLMRCDGVTKKGRDLLCSVLMEDWCPRKEGRSRSSVIRINV